MYEFNIKHSSGEEDVMRQRKHKKKNNVRLCMKCQKFISNRTFYKHKRKCVKELDRKFKNCSLIS